MVLFGALLLGGCGSLSASAALGNWATSANLTKNDAQLVADARSALRWLNDPHSTQKELHTVCAAFDFDTVSAYQSLPSPDTQTTELLTAAYTDLGDGANVCYRAGDSPAQRRRAESYIRRAGAELSEASARVSAVVGS